MILMLKLALLLMVSASAFAQPGRGWVMLGQTHVDGAIDHDRIVVNGARGEFRSLRILVKNNGIRFDRVLVHFNNGTTIPVPIREHIRAGGQSRIIDLPPGRRGVQEVEFWY